MRTREALKIFGEMIEVRKRREAGGGKGAVQAKQERQALEMMHGLAALNGLAHLEWRVAANAGLRSDDRKQRWAHVADATGLGSTEAIALCRRAEIDPDEVVPAGSACEGVGRCHGPQKWCDACGDVSDVCDQADCAAHVRACSSYQRMGTNRDEAGDPVSPELCFVCRMSPEAHRLVEPGSKGGQQ
jgi:hypothetical protein